MVSEPELWRDRQWEEGGNPCPRLHARGPAIPKAAPAGGDPGAAATHRKPAERLRQHCVQGRPGRHICQHLHHVSRCSTARLWEPSASWHPWPLLPRAPQLLPVLVKGASQHSACPAVTRTKSRSSSSSSPGQAARRVRVYWFMWRALSSAPARSVTCHGDTVLSRVPMGSCPTLHPPAAPLPEMWWGLQGQH